MTIAFYGTLSLIVLVVLIFTQEINLAVIYFVGWIMGNLVGINIVKEK